LVVITDRANPRPTISSFQSPRRVARSPHSQVRGEEPVILQDAVVEVTGNNVKMTRPIEDLVFDEK